MSKTFSLTFGAWLKLQRRTQDLTQKELARQLGCAEITIRKIEADQLRPSKHLTNALLEKLAVPRGEQERLVQLARQR
jgi:transcriptional regulator with XRE-family HTH domain